MKPYPLKNPRFYTRINRRRGGFRSTAIRRDKREPKLRESFELRDQGHSVRAVGRKLNVHHTTVVKWQRLRPLCDAVRVGGESANLSNYNPPRKRAELGLCRVVVRPLIAEEWMASKLSGKDFGDADLDGAEKLPPSEDVFADVQLRFPGLRWSDQASALEGLPEGIKSLCDDNKLPGFWFG